MKGRFKEFSGFTLVEVLIAIVITVVIGMALANVLSSSDKSYRYSVSQSQNAMAVQNVMNSIVSELKYIDTLTNPSPNSSSNRVVFGISGKEGSIYSDADSIVFESDGSITKRLAEGLAQNIAFQRSASSIKPQTVTITLTINGNIPDSQPLTTTTTVVLLNM